MVSQHQELLALVKQQTEHITKLENMVFQLQKENLTLHKQVRKLEARLHIHENANTPSSKIRFKKQTKTNNKERFPGKPKGSKGGGLKLPKPDKIIEHKINKPGYKQVGKRIKTIIDFVDNPIEVVQHIIFQYKTPNGNIIEATHNLPNGFYGKNLQAFVTMLKGRAGISHETISDLIQSIRPDISYCPATNLNITDSISTALEPVRNQILETIRTGEYCQMDETGLREDGQNGYAWIACNPTNAIYEYDSTRSGGVAQRMLGKNFDNFVVCDGYGGYNGYQRQRCWAHLLREFRELVEIHKELERDKDYLKNLYVRAVDAKNKSPDERTRIVKELDGEDELGSFIARLENKKCSKRFATTLKNARLNLFTGVIYPRIPLTNNHAERMIRKIVVHRNIMGCIRNEKGERFINNTMSCIQTWRLQNTSVYENLKQYTT